MLGKIIGFISFGLAISAAVGMLIKENNAILAREENSKTIKTENGS